jgi:hypothetical protein
MVELMQKWPKITLEVYCETLKVPRRPIQNKWSGMLTSGVVLLNGNAHRHTAARTRALLELLNGKLFDHPPCSPGSRFERLPPVELPQEPVEITALQIMRS